jgi:hypothetical protein
MAPRLMTEPTQRMARRRTAECESGAHEGPGGIGAPCTGALPAPNPDEHDPRCECACHRLR